MSRPPVDKDFQGRRVTVMGLGRFGGGTAVVRFLAERGALVTLTDAAGSEQLAESLAEIADVPLAATRVGGHCPSDFTGADLIVVNPAVRRDHPMLAAARAAGVPLSSEMNLFWQRNRGRVIAVTGSNGKSTTTALVHAILTAAGRRAWLGGNIGKSLLPEVDSIQPEDWVVLELSSFQLQDLDRLEQSPQVAVVTNFSPNHLDWHPSLDDYRNAKQSILRWQSERDIAVLNQDDEDVHDWPTRGRKLYFGLRDLGYEGVVEREGTFIARSGGAETDLRIPALPQLPGRHNRQNVAAAAGAALAAGVSPDAIARGCAGFTPLPHRLQLVATAEGRRFYNDSLATTPESAIAAIESFADPVMLLAGGYNKQVDLAALAEVISRRTKGVALLGQTSVELGRLIDAAGRSDLPRHFAESLRDAFDWAIAHSSPGSVILLSPGCASYDWFRNFAERGDLFARLAREWAATHPTSASMISS